MKYVATITDIEWVEVDSDHTPIETRQPKTPEEARFLIEHYFSSSDVFDEEDEKERTRDIVAQCGIVLKDDRNLLASSLNMVVEFGAGLPEEVVLPKPKCPKCGKEIECLVGSYAAVVGGRASILNGVLDQQLDENVKVWEIIDEDSAVWCCPECDVELFKAGQEAEMTAFLLCDKEYKGG